MNHSKFYMDYEIEVEFMNMFFFQVPSLLSQKNALIKIWTLAKYNSIPDDLEPLKYLSHYVPNLNTTHNNLIISVSYLNYCL